MPIELPPHRRLARGYLCRGLRLDLRDQRSYCLLRVISRHQLAKPIDKVLGAAAAGKADDRQTACHCFENRRGERIFARTQVKRVRGMQVSTYVVCIWGVPKIVRKR